MDQAEISIKALELAIDSYGRTVTDGDLLETAREFRDFIIDDISECERLGYHVCGNQPPATTMPKKPENTD